MNGVWWVIARGKEVIALAVKNMINLTSVEHVQQNLFNSEYFCSKAVRDGPKYFTSDLLTQLFLTRDS